MIEKKCKQCGEEFEIYPYREDEAKFCSRECHYQWKRENMEKEDCYQYDPVYKKCEVCGKEMELSKSHSDRRFCSTECMGKWQSNYRTGEDAGNWKGGISFSYGNNWREKRRKTLERDNYQCVECGKTKKEIGREPDVHHLFPYRISKNNELINLLTLCPKHHSQAEKCYESFEDYIEFDFKKDLDDLKI